MKKKITFLTLVLCFIGLNVFFASNDVKDSSYLDNLFSVKLALATGEGEGGTYAKEIECYSERAVTVAGSIATAAGISIGSLFNDGWSAEIKGNIQFEYKNGYIVYCYADSGTRNCTEHGWVACNTEGCPDAGYWTE